VSNVRCLRTDEFTGLRKNLPGHFTGSKTTERTDRILEQTTKPRIEMGNSRKRPLLCYHRAGFNLVHDTGLACAMKNEYDTRKRSPERRVKIFPEISLKSVRNT